jgi:hypothetical protein
MWTPDPSIIITAEQKAAEAQAALLAQFEDAIQAHVDASAQARKYRDGFALAGYASSTIPQFASEAQAFFVWRDAVWLYAYAELEKVAAGERMVPSVEAFIGELPVLEWPA